MPSFTIPITRIAYGFTEIEVEAISQTEAEEKALELAGDVSFSEKTADYELTNGSLAPDAYEGLPSKPLVVEAFPSNYEEVFELHVPRWATLMCSPELIRKLTTTAAACAEMGAERIELKTIDSAALRPTWEGDDQPEGFLSTKLCVTTDAFWWEFPLGNDVEEAREINTVEMSIPLLLKSLLDTEKPRIFHGNYSSSLQQDFEDELEAASGLSAEQRAGN